MLLEGPTLQLREQVMALLDRLPTVEPHALHSLGDAIGGTEPQKLEAFVDTVNEWMAARTSNGGHDAGRMHRLAQAWERINAAASEADEYNLDRKPLVFAVFGWLAEAARG